MTLASLCCPCGGSIPEDDNQCISNSPSSLCQNAAFTRCRSENGYRPEQIHLSLVEPIGMRVAWKTSADAQIKFLAAEALHGVHRLALNKAASDDIAWQCKHYSGRGVMKLHESGTALAEGMGVPVSKMPGSIEALCQASLENGQGSRRRAVPRVSER